MIQGRVVLFQDIKTDKIALFLTKPFLVFLKAPNQLITAWAFFMSIQNTVEQIKKHEGFRSRPYYCTAQKLTLGYGRNLDDVGISEQEAEILLINDLTECRAGVKRNIDIRFCNSVQVDALVNMAYNLGLSGLLAFKKMIRELEAGNFPEAANEMLDSRWASQVPSRAEELALQMVTGQWQGS